MAAAGLRGSGSGGEGGQRGNVAQMLRYLEEWGSGGQMDNKHHPHQRACGVVYPSAATFDIFLGGKANEKKSQKIFQKHFFVKTHISRAQGGLFFFVFFVLLICFSYEKKP